MKVLLVDDSRLDRELFRDQLAEHTHGWSWVEASDIDEASSWVRHAEAEQAPFDLVILDLNLIDVYGADTLTRFRYESRYKGPVVVRSGSDDEVLNRLLDQHPKVAPAACLDKRLLDVDLIAEALLGVVLGDRPGLISERSVDDLRHVTASFNAILSRPPEGAHE